MDASDKQTVDKLVQQWLEFDINPKTRNEILELQKSGDYETLHKKLFKRIAFGTAGLRSSMEAGFSHMNDVTVLQAAQGLIAYLTKNGGDSIVIGYDHRFNSQRYAELTASVAILKGFTVYYLGSTTCLSYVHTPLVPFAIDHYKASAGVMVTASHNPANDNGYKVYYGNGCQIIPPIDHGIAQSIEQNLQPWSDEAWDVVGNLAGSDLMKSVKEATTKAYIEAVAEKLLVFKDLDFEFVYTPMHGVGYEIFDKVLQLFNNVKVTVVSAQKDPDPTFWSVKFPNPEEKGALDMAIKTADEKGISLVVANDPDADRFSVAVKTDDCWKQLTGNEIGFLFGQYVIENTPKNTLKHTYLVNSTVSSQIFASMSVIEGFNFQDTLTGFKWIGNKAIDLKSKGYHVPFGYEEAIGFMFDVVNDKDGISAAVVWLQMYNQWFASHQQTPFDKLNSGYAKYGYSKECNGYYKLDRLEKTDQIFTAIRASYPGDSPSTIGPFVVTYWRDLTLGYESSTNDHKSILPHDPTSQMITAILSSTSDSGSTVRFTCRGSGTEPKLKVYIEGVSRDTGVASSLARTCWQVLRQHWFQPDVYGLQEVVNS
ncbi:hypothetical protein CANTEDRAFT_120860 [Yamadazyma tenuis ATCC 10573]|uniref:Phosphoglucomutase, first 3 domain-containing protein n=1 Tax=Candida tenuis (strain ATCC 10573 / BCRC 21748 / CBS 615 / JCM 9827 / NBRC 10315 / NRRL Y-1498 / VKM Y-70) TaxID=590646 RepID=G3B0X7_CANTC|nr:Phosphoglucomutase, first 3 domain-containing protein [Yamadazyma tenuis ATCC 10573]XP_006686012.1 uncharacterized protein CANTEDRAFT_120860 [Yamadazyma tenuis ATCC 10573]EGV65205.1 Phosphoglucomutase, first 3 domain-containing protein [Yamadazyma tenuis ATCC 10573]EGV65206.1 hypothetical protein CANTEDRAFT_120860 [Yamadazyma tenuis ATCC 10573]